MSKDGTSTREGAVKKKRKGTSSENDQDVDIYKVITEFEEKEALSRSSEVDAEIYSDTCQEIRKLLAEIMGLKLGENAAEKTQEIQDGGRNICINVATLKRLNRLGKIRLLADKEAIAAEKQKLDSINLTYQNLLYECQHLAHETSKCFQFKSKDNDIELATVDEFLKRAPAEFVGKFNSEEDGEDKTLQEHKRRLIRLEWELQERKNLSTLCSAVKEENTQLTKVIAGLKNKLDGLAPKLAKVSEATKPVQEHLDIPIDKTRSEHKIANLLPDPLYTFYVYAKTYAQVFDEGKVMLSHRY